MREEKHLHASVLWRNLVVIISWINSSLVLIGNNYKIVVSTYIIIYGEIMYHVLKMDQLNSVYKLMSDTKRCSTLNVN